MCNPQHNSPFVTSSEILYLLLAFLECHVILESVDSQWNAPPPPLLMIKEWQRNVNDSGRNFRMAKECEL